MSKGYLCLVLHAHLPYVRHPEHLYSLEEKWLFEAITECYLPLISRLNRLADEDLHFKITISLSPPLLSMLDDPYLQDKYIRYMEKLLELAEKEVKRTRGDASFHSLALMYQMQLGEIYYLFKDRYQKNLLTAFKELYFRGVAELITSTATHGYLPLLGINREAVYAQVKVGADTFKEKMGFAPRGMWLAECAYQPGDEQMLKENGIQYFFTDTHGLLYACPRPAYGIYSPLLTQAGVAAFGRDPESSKQVWSADEGYPGDPDYRDFYRDIGFDLDLDYVKPFIHPDGIRVHTGLKYYRITGKTDHKEPYNPGWANNKADMHAGNFMFNRERQMEHLCKSMDRPPVVVVPYDAELFGHWWFEGPLFLEHFIRKSSKSQDKFLIASPSDYLSQNLPLQIATPCPSSWGDKGYHEVWLNGTNDWIYRHLHHAADRMRGLAYHHPQADPLKARALNQAARELLLAQSSDWPFIMTAGHMDSYARSRVEEHMVRFNRLHRQISEGSIDEGWLARLEEKDNIFPHLDYRVYTPLEETVPVEEPAH
jgi:1,4-alpha-glucan branching enzyme